MTTAVTAHGSNRQRRNQLLGISRDWKLETVQTPNHKHSSNLTQNFVSLEIHQSDLLSILKTSMIEHGKDMNCVNITVVTLTICHRLSKTALRP